MVSATLARTKANLSITRTSGLQRDDLKLRIRAHYALLSGIARDSLPDGPIAHHLKAYEPKPWAGAVARD